MSTTHTLWKAKGATVDVTESSSTFSVSIDDGTGEQGSCRYSGWMSPEALVALGVKAIVAASYALDASEFKRAVRQAVEGPDTYAATHMRSVGYAATKTGAVPALPSAFREELQAAADFARGGHIAGTMEAQREFAERLDHLIFSIPPQGVFNVDPSKIVVHGTRSTADAATAENPCLAIRARTEMRAEIEDAILAPYLNDLRGMSVDEMERERNGAQEKVDEEQPWLEALTVALDRQKRGVPIEVPKSEGDGVAGD